MNFIVRWIVTAIAVYLTNQFWARDADFFYINLGFSRRKLLFSVILVDFLALALLMAIMHLVNG